MGSFNRQLLLIKGSNSLFTNTEVEISLSSWTACPPSFIQKGRALAIFYSEKVTKGKKVLNSQSGGDVSSYYSLATFSQEKKKKKKKRKTPSLILCQFCERKKAANLNQSLCVFQLKQLLTYEWL